MSSMPSSSSLTNVIIACCLDCRTLFERTTPIRRCRRCLPSYMEKENEKKEQQREENQEELEPERRKLRPRKVRKVERPVRKCRIVEFQKKKNVKSDAKGETRKPRYSEEVEIQAGPSKMPMETEEIPDDVEEDNSEEGLLLKSMNVDYIFKSSVPFSKETCAKCRMRKDSMFRSIKNKGRHCFSCFIKLYPEYPERLQHNGLLENEWRELLQKESLERRKVAKERQERDWEQFKMKRSKNSQTSSESSSSTSSEATSLEISKNRNITEKDDSEESSEHSTPSKSLPLDVLIPKSPETPDSPNTSEWSNNFWDLSSPNLTTSTSSFLPSPDVEMEDDFGIGYGQGSDDYGDFDFEETSTPMSSENTENLENSASEVHALTSSGISGASNIDESDSGNLEDPESFDVSIQTSYNCRDSDAVDSLFPTSSEPSDSPRSTPSGILATSESSSLTTSSEISDSGLDSATSSSGSPESSTENEDPILAAMDTVESQESTSSEILEVSNFDGSELSSSTSSEATESSNIDESRNTESSTGSIESRQDSETRMGFSISESSAFSRFFVSEYSVFSRIRRTASEDAGTSESGLDSTSMTSSMDFKSENSAFSRVRRSENSASSIPTSSGSSEPSGPSVIVNGSSKLRNLLTSGNSGPHTLNFQEAQVQGSSGNFGHLNPFQLSSIPSTAPSMTSTFSSTSDSSLSSRYPTLLARLESENGIFQNPDDRCAELNCNELLNPSETWRDENDRKFCLKCAKPILQKSYERLLPKVKKGERASKTEENKTCSDCNGKICKKCYGIIYRSRNKERFAMYARKRITKRKLEKEKNSKDAEVIIID